MSDLEFFSNCSQCYAKIMPTTGAILSCGDFLCNQCNLSFNGECNNCGGKKVQKLTLNDKNLPFEVSQNLVDPSKLMDDMFETLTFQIKHYRKIIDTITTLKDQYEKEAKTWKQQATSLRTQLDQLKQQKRPLDDANDGSDNQNKSRRFTSKQSQDNSSTPLWHPSDSIPTTISRPQSANIRDTRTTGDLNRLQQTAAGTTTNNRPLTAVSVQRGQELNTSISNLRTVSSDMNNFDQRLGKNQNIYQNQSSSQNNGIGQRLFSPSGPRPNTANSLNTKSSQNNRPLSADQRYQESDYFKNKQPRSLNNKPTSAGSPYKNHVQSSVIRTPSNTGIIPRPNTVYLLLLLLLLLLSLLYIGI